jgi:hypothetical protein
MLFAGFWVLLLRYFSVGGLGILWWLLCFIVHAWRVILRKSGFVSGGSLSAATTRKQGQRQRQKQILRFAQDDKVCSSAC